MQKSHCEKDNLLQYKKVAREAMPSLLCNNKIGSHPGQSNMYIKILITNQYIDHHLSHIQLQFGDAKSDKNICPEIFGIVDSGASVTLGNLLFWTRIVRAYPHIVRGIAMAAPDGYSPI